MQQKFIKKLPIKKAIVVHSGITICREVCVNPGNMLYAYI
jgi:hypothetical protein